jgi:hypothetical protein
MSEHYLPVKNVSKSPCAEYQLVPSTGLPESPDRFHWFKPGVLDHIETPDCFKALLACDFNRQFHPNDRLKQKFDRFGTPSPGVQFCTRSTEL